MHSDIINNVADYVTWTETVAIYPRDDEDRANQYELLGFISEIGEVCGMLKRQLRDPDYTLERLQLKLELGDVAWYLARLHYDHDEPEEDSEKSHVTKFMEYLEIKADNNSCFEVSRAIFEHFKDLAKSRSKLTEYLIGRNVKSISSLEELHAILIEAKENTTEEEAHSGITAIAMCEMYQMSVPKLMSTLIDNCKSTVGIIGFYVLCDRFRFNYLDVMRANVTKLEDRKERDRLHGKGDNR